MQRRPLTKFKILCDQSTEQTINIRNTYQHGKSICDRDNLIPHKKNSKFSHNIRNAMERPFSSFSFNTEIEVFIRAMRERNERVQTRTGDVKVFLLTDNMNLYLKVPKDSTRKFMDPVNTCSK